MTLNSVYTKNLTPSLLVLDKRTPKFQDVPIFLYDKIPLDGNPDDGGDISQRKGLLFVGGASYPPNVDAMQWFLK